MNTIFEAKSFRVKGISFHHKNPWVLTSLHNGEIHLYDYINGILLDKFSEHEGPVRSVHFHNTQPFFTSGGDDCKIKIWNYNTKKCQFNLTGHTDYIRTVQFHHELPWILSASDDQTIRVWNWLNRTLLTTATGHDHYVMSAFFHPSQDLIVSASLDQTIRIWDYSVLRKKFFEARSNSLEVIALDITMKMKIEGHERGVNWAVFHPTLNLIASASDDKTIKIWKYTDSRYTDADTLKGHHNNVSSVVFHPKQDYLISNSEDKTIRVWDLTKKSVVDKITKENDRFWVLACHPTLNIFASGCDSGLNVFKLERSYIPSASIHNHVIFCHNKTIHLWKYGEAEKKNIYEIRNLGKGLKSDFNSMVINPFVNPSQILNFVLTTNDQHKKVIYYFLRYDQSSHKFIATNSDQVIENAISACFLSNNKILTLSNTGNFNVMDVNNFQSQFSFELPNLSKDKFEGIFQGPLGKIILKFKNGIVGLLDVNTKKLIQETNEMTDLKFVTWNTQYSIGALVGKNSIFIINKNFDVLAKIKENSSIKSVCFDENNVMYYTTHFHIKYSLQDGSNGIIKSLETPVYLMMVNNGLFYLSDSLQNIKTENFNYAEVRFKISLFNKNYDDVVNILRSGVIHGLKAIENIQNAGFPDLSLKFVNDPKQKFYLALQSGKLEEASSAADILKDKIYYDKLAEKAMMMGKLNIAEFCYVKSENWDKLILFYVLSGRLDKLKILQEVLQNKGDNSRRFLNSIYTGNIDEKICLLTETGHVSLAYLTAKIHNKCEYMQIIEENTKNVGKEIILNLMDVNDIENRIRPSVPLKPIISLKNKEYHTNWVTHTEIKRVVQSNLDNILNQAEDGADSSLSGIQTSETASGFGFNIGESVKKEEPATTKTKVEEQKKKIESKWNDEEEEDEDEEIKKIIEEKSKNTKNSIESLIIKEDDHIYLKFERSSVPGVQLALGNIKMAFNYLKSQLGIVSNLEQLKSVMKDIYMSSYSQIKLIPCLPVNEFLLRQTKNGVVMPQNGVTIQNMRNLFNNALELVTDKNMQEALNIFRDIIKYAIFFIASDKSEENAVRELIISCAEYIYLTRLSLLSDSVKSEKLKNAEICSIMTTCTLDTSIHKFLILKSAKAACKSIGNYITASIFIKKMMIFEKELGSTFKNHFDQARQELDTFQKAGTNKHNLTFNVNENLPCARSYFCAKTFNRLENNSKLLKCPLCQSITVATARGEICSTCNLCNLGEDVLGLKLSESYE